MLNNYLKVAFRNLLRHKGYSFINIAGLAIGLACCLVIFQYVAFEYSFDRFHEHEGDLYRVNTGLAPIGEPLGWSADTPHGMGPALAEAVPEILHVARLRPAPSAVVSRPSHPEQVFEEQAFYVDPAFLEMFTFPLAAGTAATALTEPGTALLSSAMARKYFGAANPIGQVLDVTGEVEGSYRVTGVFEDVPANSHLQFDLLLPMADLLAGERYSEAETFWIWNNFVTYVQLSPGADRAAVAQKMTATYDAHFPDAFREQGLVPRVLTQPLRDIHLNADIGGPELEATIVLGSYRTVYFFTVIGLVTLIIALVNYVNLATARALGRASEVGVRKAVGAQREQLITQFLFESALTNVVAAVLAVALAVALTPLVNDLAGMNLTWTSWSNPAFWGAFAVTLCVGTLLAGLYPAFVLSSFKPATVLKGKGGTFGGQLWLRRGLVVFQFAASVVLIVGTAVVYNQLMYMRQMELGLDLEQVLTVNGPRVLPEGADAETAVNTFADELRRLPSVRQVATSVTLPGGGFSWNGVSVWKAEDNPTSATRGVVTFIDTSFASLYGMELMAGNMDEFLLPPTSAGWAWTLIPNETAVASLGFASPAEAVGRSINVGGNDAVIVGVFRDANWSSAHEARKNIFFGRTSGGRHLSLRVGTDDLPGTIAAIQGAYTRLFPGNVFKYAFADDAFDQQYRNDERFATLFTLFAALAIFIACLGLFGLAAFTAQLRRKEIGVRKVLGASIGSIVALLSKDYVLLVLGAFGVAVPVVFFLMRRWLEGFAYHVTLGPGVFLLSGVLVLAFALLTVSTQALRAAATDPVKALRSE